MALVRYSPWDITRDPWDLTSLQNEINRLFSSRGDLESSSATARWVPAVDIYEYDDRFQLFVDLPGIDSKSVDVTLERGVLTISGERAEPAPSGEQQPVRRRTERGHGQFHRRFTLPDTVDADNVKATERNGVLEISIPKEAKALPRRIPVAA